MILRISGSNFLPCYVCHQPIAKHSLCVGIQTLFQAFNYHLKCLRPIEFSPIKFDHFYFLGVSDEHIDRLKRRIVEWNGQFLAKEEQISSVFLEKKVTTVAPIHRRALIEIFDFLSIFEMETMAARTCKAWFHITRELELWKSRYVSHFRPKETISDDDFRRKFITDSMNSCWNCSVLVSELRLSAVSRLMNRPLCNECEPKKECMLMSIEYFCCSRLVEMDTIAKLKIPSLTDKGKKFSHLKVVTGSVLPYAEHRRERLIEVLRSEKAKRMSQEEIDLISTLDLKKFYADGIGIMDNIGKVMRSLAVYCGENDENEDFGRHVRQFVERLNRKWRAISFSYKKRKIGSEYFTIITDKLD